MTESANNEAFEPLKGFGVMLVDKPKGITSFDVIKILKRKYGDLKMGHAGTLDPLASGLLVVAVGKTTKEISRYMKLPKTYEVEILFGKRTTTGDLDGKILEEKDVSSFDFKEIEKAILSLKGENILPVPMYSAIKFQGKRLYKIARSGEKFDENQVPKKNMVVRGVEVKSHSSEGTNILVKASLDVESGVYVRSIVEEIGNRLKIPATVNNLRRVSIGDLKIEDAFILNCVV